MRAPWLRSGVIGLLQGLVSAARVTRVQRRSVVQAIVDCISGVQSLPAVQGRMADLEVAGVLRSSSEQLYIPSDPLDMFWPMVHFWATALALYVAALAAAFLAWRRRRELRESADDTANIFSPRKVLAMEALMAQRDSLAPDQSLPQVMGEREDTEQHARLKRLRKYYFVQWYLRSEESRYHSGFVALCLLSWVLLVYRVFCLHRDFNSVDSSQCHGPIHFEIRLAELVVLILVLVVIHVTLWQGTISSEHITRYWVLMIFFLFHIPACTLPPFQWACVELVVYCSTATEEAIKRSVFQMDCSLQGQTAVMKFVTVILYLPWLVIDRDMIRIVWILITFVYVSWTLSIRYWLQDGSFSTAQIVLRTLILVLACIMSDLQKYYLQKQQQNGYISDVSRHQTSHGLYSLMKEMLPTHALRRVLIGEQVADEVSHVSVMFVTVNNFESIVNEREPSEVVAFLNGLFSKFDRICEDRGVTKIESVGDEYVCCVGVLPSDIEMCKTDGHRDAMQRLVRAAGDMLRTQTEGLEFKMGMHTGPIVAGVISKKLPRYRLFGSTINTAARMMQKGLPGKLQFGEACRQYMSSAAMVEDRGEVEMKGLGKQHVYLFSGFLGTPAEGGRLVSCSSLAQEGQEQEEGRADVGRRWRMPLLYKLIHVTTPPELRYKHEEEEAQADTVTSPLTAISSESACREADLEVIVKSISDSNLVNRMRERRMMFGIEAVTFTTTMESEFRLWRHQGITCKKLVPRINGHFWELVSLTALEMIALWVLRDDTHAFAYWPAYIFCRCVSLVLILSLGKFVETHHKWVWWHPAACQACILACYCLVALLVYTSYVSLTIGNDGQARRLGISVERGHDISVRASRAFRNVFSPTQVFSFMFVLFYVRIMRAHALPFFYSLFWIPLAVLITVLMKVHAERKEGALSFTRGVSLLFLANAVVTCLLVLTFEETQRKWFRTKTAIAEAQDRMSNMLDTLMPKDVIDDLRARQLSCQLSHPESFQLSHNYRLATVAQSDLCGFTALSSTRGPAEVVEFLADLFGRFDVLADKLGIWKVETVGDAYIAAQAEPPLTEGNSPSAVVLFGLQMVREVNAWAEDRRFDIRCRVGVHHGECTGGIVGTSMQRYHLFGDLMVGVEVLESTAPTSSVQVSASCKLAVEDEMAGSSPSFEFKPVETPFLRTSKGEEHSFEEVGGPTFTVLRMHIARSDRHVDGS